MPCSLNALDKVYLDKKDRATGRSPVAKSVFLFILSQKNKENFHCKIKSPLFIIPGTSFVDNSRHLLIQELQPSLNVNVSSEKLLPF